MPSALPSPTLLSRIFRPPPSRGEDFLPVHFKAVATRFAAVDGLTPARVLEECLKHHEDFANAKSRKDIIKKFEEENCGDL